MFFIYKHIKEDRARSVMVFLVFISLFVGAIAGVSEFVNGNPASIYLAGLFFISVLLTTIWQLVYEKDVFNYYTAAAILSLELFFTTMAFFAYGPNILFPVLFLLEIIGTRFLLPRKPGQYISLAAILFYVLGWAVLMYGGWMTPSFEPFTLVVLPAILVDFVCSFSLNIIAQVKMQQKQAERKNRELIKNFRGLRKNYLLKNELVTSLHNDVRRKNIEIKNILTLSDQLNVNVDPLRAIESFLLTVMGQLGSGHALIFTQRNLGDGFYSVYALRGMPRRRIENHRIYLNSNLLEYLLAFKHPIKVGSIPRENLYSDEIKFLNLFKNDLFCPIMIKGEIAGIFIIGQKLSGKNFTMEDHNLVAIIANQAAFVMEQSQVSSEFQDIYFKTIKAMMKALEAKYVFARGHNTRTANYASITARSMGMSHSVIKDLTYGTLLHDVGKIAIRDKYLLDPKVFHENETIVKKKILEHTLKGATILKSAGFDDNIVELALRHHESYEGSGYPHGLGGSDLSTSVRILSVCNTYDAMTSDKPYRKALSPKTAKEYITYQANRKFDPTVVKAFLNELNHNKEMQKYH